MGAVARWLLLAIALLALVLPVAPTVSSTAGVTLPSIEGVTVSITEGVTLPSIEGVTVSITEGVTLQSTEGVTLQSSEVDTVPRTEGVTPSTEVAAVEAPECLAGTRCRMTGALGEYVYFVEDGRFIVDFTDGGYFGARCDNVSLDSDALPRFPRVRRVARVRLAACAPPRSYRRALAALGVEPLDSLALHRPAAPLLPAPFAALAVPALSVEDAAAAPGFLRDAAALRSLRLELVPLDEAGLARLPPALSALHLVRCGLAELAAPALARLRNLTALAVRDTRPVALDAAAAPRLVELTLDAPEAAAPRAPLLRRLQLWHWGEAAPGAWRACAELRSLELVLAAARALPPRWLAACPRLRRLGVSRALLRALPAALLGGAAALREFNVTSCLLASVPPSLFNETPELLTINLAGNLLESLPSGLFTRVSRLKVLDLSHNKLHAVVAAQVASISSLRWLALADNPLGDLCDRGVAAVAVSGLSPLHRLTSLEELELQRVGLTQVCRDWRDVLTKLRRLDLSYNNITHLMFSEVVFRREDEASVVDLLGNPVSVLEYSREQFLGVRGGRLRAGARVLLRPRLACDCRAYWPARLHADHAARCRAEQLWCPLPCAPCACAWRPDEARGRVLRARCAARNLTAPPALPAPPAQLQELDLRDNLISRLDVAAVSALLSGGAALRLAGNPLACDCAAAPLLAALRSHRPQVDYSALQCPGKGALEAVEAECGGGGGGGVGGFAYWK